MFAATGGNITSFCKMTKGNGREVQIDGKIQRA
jgi:hypothetical protein